MTKPGFRARQAALLTVVAMLVGCPAPTGRRRGPIEPDSGNACPPVGLPPPGAQCDLEGEFCINTSGCPFGGTRVDDCACISGSWRCTFGECPPPPPDSGPAECPPIEVFEGDACTMRQQPLWCAGVAPDCNGSTIAVACSCDGTQWHCPPPPCADAGAPDGG